MRTAISADRVRKSTVNRSHLPLLIIINDLLITDRSRKLIPGADLAHSSTEPFLMRDHQLWIDKGAQSGERT